jgi:hypothetical protein
VLPACRNRRGWDKLMRRIEVWLLIAILLVAGAWALVWWLISSHVEEAVAEALAASGEGDVAIACEERGQRGFPFRFEIVCSGLTARAADATWSARLERMNAGAVVHRPRDIDAILTGPLAVEAAALDGPATLEWSSARASLVADRDGPQSGWLRLFSARGEIAATRLMVHQARFEIEPDGEGGSRLAADIQQLRLAPAAAEALPPIDWRFEARTPIPAEALLSGAVDPSDGVSIRDLAASLATARVEAHAEGDFDIDPAGLASGSLTVYLLGMDNLPALLENLPENARTAANVAVGALMALAAPAEWRGRPASRIELIIDEGEVRAGPLALGRLPPLWQAPLAL